MERILIIGQGIAGTSLAWTLSQRSNYQFHIIDAGVKSCSMVAAGLINPFTGRRLSKTWLADDILPFAQQFYTQVESQLGLQFYHPTTILRLVADEAEFQLNLSKVEPADLAEYQITKKEISSTSGIHPNGTLLSYSGAAWVDALAYITASRTFWINSNCFTTCSLDIEADNADLQLGIFQGQQYDRVVFCQGHLARFNPLFPTIEHRPVKGEVLTIYAPDLNLQKEVLLKGIYIIPLGDGKFRVGASYSWDDLNNLPSAFGKAEVLRGLAKMITVPFQILDHQSGIRPAVPSRRPIIAQHLEFPKLWMYNGLGTKGLSLSPYISSRLVSHWATGSPLPEGVLLDLTKQ